MLTLSPWYHLTYSSVSFPVSWSILDTGVYLGAWLDWIWYSGRNTLIVLCSYTRRQWCHCFLLFVIFAIIDDHCQESLICTGFKMITIILSFLLQSLARMFFYKEVSSSDIYSWHLPLMSSPNTLTWLKIGEEVLTEY